MCSDSNVSTTADSLPNDIESLRALALKAIAERDVRGLRPNSIFHMAPSDETRQMMVKFANFVLGKAFLEEGQGDER